MPALRGHLGNGFMVLVLTATAIVLLVVALIASELGKRLRHVDAAARAERASFHRLCRVVEPRGAGE